MFGALIKTYYAEKLGFDPENIVSVALMPCSAKKFECNRPEMRDSGYKDVDFGLTTRELGKMFKEAGLRRAEPAQVGLRRPVRLGHRLRRHLRRHGRRHGGRAAHRARDGHRREGREHLRPRRHHPGARLRGRQVRRDHRAQGRPGAGHRGAPRTQLGVAQRRHPQGGRGTRHRQRQEGHGRHQGRRQVQRSATSSSSWPARAAAWAAAASPYPPAPEIRAARAKAIYSEDSAYAVRKSHENPAVLQTYAEFLTEGPCGHKSHKLLHTEYTARGRHIPQ